MRRGLLVIALVASAHGAGAQPVDLNGKGLESCLQTARGADQACGKLTDDPAQRLDCFQKARAAELECLEQALSPDTPTANAGPESPAATPQPEQPSAAASPDPAVKAEAKQEAPLSPPDPPTGSILGQEPKIEPKVEPKIEPKIVPADRAPAESVPTQRAPAASADPVPPAEAPKTAPAEAAVAATPPDVTSGAGLRGAADWVVSETTSPVDYSPLFSAVIRPASRLHDGPSSLSVRCRRGRTELSVHNESGWRPTRNDGILIDHRVNREPIVRLMWKLSADAKTATFADDPVELLRALPDGALVSISISDGANARREATFAFAGWNAIRQKLASLCNWPSLPERAPQARR